MLCITARGLFRLYKVVSVAILDHFGRFVNPSLQHAYACYAEGGGTGSQK